MLEISQMATRYDFYLSSLFWVLRCLQNKPKDLDLVDVVVSQNFE